MLKPRELEFHSFNQPKDPLFERRTLKQAQYLLWYLSDLGAKGVLVEPQYFDRDYLSEFTGFYAASAAGYPNVCQRVHYFTEPVTRKRLQRAVGGDAGEQQALQTAYLGFVVIRPIRTTPLGRTVLKTYPDTQPDTPRITNPSRDYECHVAGLTFRVNGLAWQQQDQGVGACATIALWTMLHSQAFDDRHIVPTTAEVTQIAQRTGAAILRGLPSKGLSLGQLAQAVRDSGFTPQVIPGEAKGFFTKEHFNSSVASFIRSGYPILVLGQLEKWEIDHNGETSRIIEGGHVVCAGGFRQAVMKPPTSIVEFEDLNNSHVYLHDDNLGPAVRFRVDIDEHEQVVLIADAPKHTVELEELPDPAGSYSILRPDTLLAASHDDVRVSPDELHQYATDVAYALSAVTPGGMGFTVSTRITPLVQYLEQELAQTLRRAPTVLAHARLALCEKVRPMSRHLGLIRLGQGSTLPLMDVLLDTTDSIPNLSAFCHVAYDANLARAAHDVAPLDLGIQVCAF